MQYFQAVRLGHLHQQLGVPAKSRVSLQISTGQVGAFIWDLDSGNYYLVTQSSLPGKSQFEVPKHVKNIIAAKDEDLKKRWLETMAWDEERETVFSELTFRGMDILSLEGIC